MHHKNYFFLSLFLFLPLNNLFPQYVAFYRGQVKDILDNTIVNVSVTAAGAETTYTAPDGRFFLRFHTLPVPDSAGNYISIIYYSHPDYYTSSDTLLIIPGDTLQAPDKILRPLTQPDLVTVSGSLLFSNNTPLNDAYVSFYGSERNYVFYVTDGNFQGEIKPGRYYIHSAYTYRYQESWTRREIYYDNKSSLSEADQVTILNDTSGLNLVLPWLGLGTITGKVIDAETQQPIRNAWVSVSSTEPRDSSFTGTDSHGNYSITVFEGDYRLFTYEQGYYQLFYNNANNSFEATPVTVMEDSTVSGINFNLTKPQPGANIISGMVDGIAAFLGLQDVTVSAIPVSGGRWIETKTGYDGRFVLQDISNGEYVLLFSKEGYISKYYDNSQEWEKADRFILTGNQVINNVYAYLYPVETFGGEISGTITTNAGAALSGTLITAYDLSGNIISAAVSGYNGKYVLPSLKSGSYTLHASRTGYPTTAHSGEIFIDLNNSPVVEGVTISISSTGIDDHPLQPGLFILRQNYPNPFNPVTTISYTLPYKEKAVLKVFDILGNEAAEIVNEIQDAGRHEVKFNAGSLASGVYFYQLTSGRYTAVKKLIILK